MFLPPCRFWCITLAALASGVVAPLVVTSATETLGDGSPSQDAETRRAFYHTEATEPEVILLGSESLFQGIPGTGPLTVAQIQAWLERAENHRPLVPRLPWHISQAERLVRIPPDNPLTRAKIELGRQLFFDTRIGTMNCAVCHRPEQSYTAGQVFPDTGLNPLAAFNRILGAEHFWDGKAASLEELPHVPATNPYEMNISPEEVTAFLYCKDGYRMQLERVFGEVSFSAYTRALASFQRALVAGPSAHDHLLAREQLGNRPRTELSSLERQILSDAIQHLANHPPADSALRGRELFFSDRTGCVDCHVPPNFTDEDYHDLGIRGTPTTTNLGRYKVTWQDEDRGRFKTPTLRNISRTPPYMHNGQFGTLEEVVRFFSRGEGRAPGTQPAVEPLHLTASEEKDLVAFLKLLDSPLPTVRQVRFPE